MTAPQCGLWVALVCPNQSTERLWPPPSFQGSLPICSLPCSLEGSGCPLNLTPRSGLTLCRVMGSHISPWSPQSLGQSPTPEPTPMQGVAHSTDGSLGERRSGDSSSSSEPGIERWRELMPAKYACQDLILGCEELHGRAWMCRGLCLIFQTLVPLTLCRLFWGWAFVDPEAKSCWP